MLIPVCCFSCGQCIGHLWEQYNSIVKTLDTYDKSNADAFNTAYERNARGVNNFKLNNINRILERIRNNDELGVPSSEELAMISLGISRMCCRRMFLTQADTYNLMNLN